MAICSREHLKTIELTDRGNLCVKMEWSTMDRGSETWYCRPFSFISCIFISVDVTNSPSLLVLGYGFYAWKYHKIGVNYIAFCYVYLLSSLVMLYKLLNHN